MTDPISKKMNEHYTATIKKHGACAKGVDWRDEETSRQRHKCMKELIISSQDENTLLDVGCGYGDFLTYLNKNPHNILYSGIDISEKMLDLARQSHTSKTFYHGDFLETEFEKNFDYIICNGILTQKFDFSLLEMEVYFKRIVKKMFQEANVGCCFNMMSTRVNFFAPNLFYRHPSEVLSYCLTEITSNIKIDHSYGLYEFTVYLYK